MTIAVPASAATGNHLHILSSSPHQDLFDGSPADNNNSNNDNSSAMMLPDVHSGGGGGGGVVGGRYANHHYVTDLSPESIMMDNERLRQMVKLKDLDVVKLRGENMILKQIERRQQRELEHLQTEYTDAPKLIKALREQLQGLKLKLKDSYAQHSSDDRAMRQQNEAMNKLKDQNQKFTKLVQEQDLDSRDNLSREIEKTKEEVAMHRTKTGELEHRFQLTLKNYQAENERFRIRVRSLEQENQVIKDVATRLETAIKDKDKEIASLGIYRYNMIHKKPEVAAECKVCLQREKEEVEADRLRKAVEIPIPTHTTLRVISGTSLEATVTVNNDFRADTGATFSVSSIIVTCADDENMTINARTVTCSAKTPSLGNISTAAQQQHQHTGNEALRPSALQQPRILTVRGFFDELDPGKHYYVKAAACFDDRIGEHGPSECIYLDVIPNPPSAPKAEIGRNLNGAKAIEGTTAFTSEAATIQVTLPRQSSAVNKSNGGSHLIAYRLYHSSLSNQQRSKNTTEEEEDDDGGREWFLLEEIPLSADQSNESVRYTYVDPAPGLPHVFRCTAVNQAGESSMGLSSRPIIIDVCPLQPIAPTIQSLGSTKIRVMVTEPSSNGGTEVLNYKILCTAVDKEGLPLEGSEVIAKDLKPPSGIQPSMVIEGLHPGNYYVVRVIAVNAAGESLSSEPSSILELCSTLPIPSAPRAEHFEEGIRIIFDALPADLDEKLKSEILGREMLYARDEKSLTNITNIIATRLPLELGSFEVKNLKPGRSYWFAVSYFSANDAGICSTAIKCRAPSDKIASTDGSTEVQNENPLPSERSISLSSLGSERRLSKTSSQLSFDQKILNMHRGMPSQHQLPESEDPSANLLSSGPQANQTQQPQQSVSAEVSSTTRRSSRHGSLTSVEKQGLEKSTSDVPSKTSSSTGSPPQPSSLPAASAAGVAAAPRSNISAGAHNHRRTGQVKR